MAGKAVPNMKGVRVFPPPPKGFDALAATKTDLARHGIPQRPDPRTQPGLAALWEQRARRYQDFEHLEPKLLPPDKPTEPVAAGFGLSPLVSCGFELTFPAPITILSGTWTVPDLNHSPTPEQFPNHFHTFFGLGFLDVHVEMTVDTAQNVTSPDPDPHRSASRPSGSPRRRDQRHAVPANQRRRYRILRLGK